MDGEGFEGRSGARASSIPPPALPIPKSHHTSLLPGNQLLDWEEGGGDILYQGCESQFHALCFSYGGLAGWLAGCTRRNVLWTGPQRWESDWETGIGQGVAGLLHGPGGAYLNQGLSELLHSNTVIVLQLHETQKAETERGS